jgi:hypothetical protein
MLTSIRDLAKAYAAANDQARANPNDSQRKAAKDKALSDALKARTAFSLKFGLFACHVNRFNIR